MRTHFVVHEAFEGPGIIEDWARARGHDIRWSLLYDADPLPSAADDIDLLVVLGGPQQTTTTRTECAYFDAAAEKALILSAIKADKAVVGVCLGAQLIGEALGAAAEPSPYREIGCFPVRLTDAGKRHEFFADYAAKFIAGHWHDDMPGLTPDAAVLATSAGCPRQIVAYGKRVYGFQCHMEFTPDLVKTLIAQAEEDPTSPEGNPFVRPAVALQGYDFTAMNNQLTAFLDRLVSESPTAGAGGRRETGA
ncbi:GMP synthase [Kutzneria viridogrisea]|uniref:GMP synthase (Glutamine-hydrolyzing) n=1 Tax=Kutzneria viridogrisea TaxID=47990 RepID=A0ABR6BVN1_9PSEU|nr:GMP synthase (glutamine-hydrolyzing) [Kutzneria viridogrisea]